MSEPDPQALEGVRAADAAPGGRAAIVVAAMVALTVATAAVLYGLAPQRGAVPAPTLDVSPADPFARPTAHEQERAEQRARREQWQWLDRAHGRVRRPLAAAIDAYLAEQPR